jgi:hypothetical protein
MQRSNLIRGASAFSSAADSGLSKAAKDRAGVLLGSSRAGARAGLAAIAALALSGFASSATADSGGLFDGLSNFNLKNLFPSQGSNKQPNEQQDDKAGSQGSQGHHLFCPEIIVLDGTAAFQAHAGSPPTNMNLRYQYALGDAVRECAVSGDQLAIKVGIAGNVLLGPAGTPASFSVPLRVAIVGAKDNQPLVTKLYRVAATIPQGQAQTGFQLVTEPLLVPFKQDHAEDDYTIKVGIDEGPEKPAGKDKRERQAD